MVSLLRRRAMMVQAAAPVSTLLVFDDRDFTISAGGGGFKKSYLTVSNGNHFKYYCGRRGNSYSAYVNLTETSITANSSWPAMFSINAGDAVNVVLRNVSIKCDKSASYNGYVQFTLRDTSTASVFGWTGTTSDSPLYAVGGSPKTYEELTVSFTAANSIDFASFRFYGYGSAQSCNMELECDVEIYINDTRIM